MLSVSFKKPSLTLHISIGSPDLHAHSSYTLPNTVLSFCLHADLSLDLKLVLLTSCSLAPRTVPINTCQIIRKQPAQFAQGTWDLGLDRWSWVTASIFHPTSGLLTLLRAQPKSFQDPLCSQRPKVSYAGRPFLGWQSLPQVPLPTHVLSECPQSISHSIMESSPKEESSEGSNNWWQQKCCPPGVFPMETEKL